MDDCSQPPGTASAGVCGFLNAAVTQGESLVSSRVTVL